MFSLSALGSFAAQYPPPSFCRPTPVPFRGRPSLSAQSFGWGQSVRQTLSQSPWANSGVGGTCLSWSRVNPGTFKGSPTFPKDTNLRCRIGIMGFRFELTQSERNADVEAERHARCLLHSWSLDHAISEANYTLQFKTVLLLFVSILFPVTWN